MFKRKNKLKMYEIVYRRLNTYSTIVTAKDEFKAIKKFHKMTCIGVMPTIISFREITFDKTGEYSIYD